MTRLIVPFHQREAWDREQEARRIKSLAVANAAFSKRQMEYSEMDNAQLRSAGLLIDRRDNNDAT